MAVVAGAAMDLDAAASRAVTAADRLGRAGEERLAAVVRAAAVQTARAAHDLRRDGFFGGVGDGA